jgi:hypothetical protein
MDNLARIARADYVPTNGAVRECTVRLRALTGAQRIFSRCGCGRSALSSTRLMSGADRTHTRGRCTTSAVRCAVLRSVRAAAAHAHPAQRGQRPSWIPFFDDATALIFLAPISAFDQYLAEDARVNRIDDSLQLWTLVCTNRLLHRAALVLLLNKADVLRRKLDAGARVRRFVTSYGDRPNTFEAAAQYFRGHFVQVQKRRDARKRPLYVHFSSMLDISDSQRIIVTGASGPRAAAAPPLTPVQ